MKCIMSGGHRANTDNTAKLNRLRCSYIENSYCKNESSIPLLQNDISFGKINVTNLFNEQTH